jgi:hypothetical protein
VSPRLRIISLLLPAGLLAGWVALAAGQEVPSIAVCRHRAADGLDARPIDLSRVDREYTKAAKAFRERLKAVETRTVALRDRGHDAGVKACARPEKRCVALGDPLPAKLWGRRLYFLSAAGGNRLPLGLQAPLDPESVVFLLRYPSLEDAGKLAQILKVGVTPGTPALVQRLGIRCLTSIVDVSRDGKTLNIQEIEP